MFEILDQIITATLIQTGWSSLFLQEIFAEPENGILYIRATSRTGSIKYTRLSRHES